ncbi:glycosyltransferase family 4 protein [Haladaptatus sp. DYSN1]|uniref:glycosyltransferase family 4 protein n=1 Tax=unclassified Haladaptatus TaxID=2622732 RepID=UPI002405417E|nr:glycosyltransferase family 4 protein [Haladaptatus sp. DYSN1]
MNVLFVLEYYPPHLGGIQIVFENVAERLAARGHHVSVVTSKTEGTPAYEYRNGVHVYRSRVFGPLDRYTFAVTGIPKALSLAKEADIIHTSTWAGCFPAWLARMLRNKPTVMTVHEVFSPVWNISDRGFADRTIHKVLERAIYSLSFDRYTTVSGFTKECLVEQGKDPDIVDVVYNGIDDALFDERGVDERLLREQLDLDDTFVYTYYGRPGFSKGVDDLVRAVPAVAAEIPDSTLLLILGKTPPHRFERIRRLISELGVEDNVTLIDPVPRSDLPHYVGGSDCVVIPSLQEGFGFTAAEASALGVPVVATTAGSLPEVVSGTHCLVEPQNPASIAQGIVDVYHGKAAETPRKTFDWDRTVDAYLAVYESVLGTQPVAPLDSAVSRRNGQRRSVNRR